MSGSQPVNLGTEQGTTSGTEVAKPQPDHAWELEFGVTDTRRFEHIPYIDDDVDEAMSARDSSLRYEISPPPQTDEPTGDTSFTTITVKNTTWRST